MSVVEEEKEEEPEPEEEEQAPPPEEGDWQVWITTGSNEGAETENQVSLVVYGEDGVTDPFILPGENDDQNVTYFSKGNTDEFKVCLSKIQL